MELRVTNFLMFSWFVEKSGVVLTDNYSLSLSHSLSLSLSLFRILSSLTVLLPLLPSVLSLCLVVWEPHQLNQSVMVKHFTSR